MPDEDLLRALERILAIPQGPHQHREDPLPVLLVQGAEGSLPVGLRLTGQEPSDQRLVLAVGLPALFRFKIGCFPIGRFPLGLGLRLGTGLGRTGR